MKKFLSAIFMLAVCNTSLFALCSQPATYTQSFGFCGSGSVTVGGQTHSASTTTTYIDTLHGAAVGGCDSIVTTTIGIYTVPAAPSAVSNFTVNTNNVVSPVTLTAPDTTLFCKWRSSNTTVGLPTAYGVGNLPQFTAVNNSNVPITDTITVTTRSRGYLYIAADSGIYKYDYVNNKIIDTIYLPNGGKGAIQVLEAPAGNVAYILSYAFTPGLTNTRSIYVLDLATDRIVRTINYSFTGITDYREGAMVISPDGNTLYFTTYILNGNGDATGGYLVKLDIQSGSITLSTPPLNISTSGTHGLCISPDGHYIYATSYLSYPIKIDLTSMTATVVTGNGGLGGNMITAAMTPDGRRVYMAGDYELAEMNTANDSVVKDWVTSGIDNGLIVTAMSFTPDSSHLWLLCGHEYSEQTQGNGEFYRAYLDLATDSILSITQVGPGDVFNYGAASATGVWPIPNICVTPDGQYNVIQQSGYWELGRSPVGTGTAWAQVNNLLVQNAKEVTGDYGSVGNMVIPGHCESSAMSFTITINPVKRDTQGISICSGQSILVAAHTYNTTGVYVDTLAHASIYGTDSIVTTNLTVIPYATSYQAFTFCGSGSVTAGTTTYSTTGYYSDTLHAAAGNGCDSIVFTNLTINPVLPAPGIFSNRAACAGDPVFATTLGTATTGNSILWTGSSSSIGLAGSGSGTVPSFTSVNNGSTPVIDTITVTNTSTGYAYIANPNFGSVSVMNRQTGAIAATVSGLNSPGGIAVSPNGSKVYATNQSTNNLSVINTATNTVLTTINVGTSPQAVAVSLNGKRIYVANSGSANVSVIDSSTNTVVATIPVGNSPVGIAAGPDGMHAYVVNSADSSVSVINTLSNTVSAVIRVGHNPYGVAVNATGAQVYVTNLSDGTVSVINAATNTVTGTFTVGQSPKGVSVTPDGKYVYAANYLDNTVSAISTATNTVLPAITVGQRPTGTSVSADGNKVYVTNYSGGSVSVISTASNTVSATYTGFPAPASVGNFVTGTGCSSAASKYTITVNPIVRHAQSFTICSGGVTVGAHTYTTAGTYLDTLQGGSVYGCDSIVTTQLTVIAGITSAVTTTICQGSSYAGHSTTGTFVDHYAVTGGCDSARTLNLTVTNNLTSTITTAVCAGSNYAGHTTTGTFVDHFTSAGGCDSARTLNLTVKPNSTSTITTAICAGSNYAGHTTGGTFVDHYTNATGCDSARTLNLTVSPNVTSTIATAICQGSNYAGHTTTGMFTDHYTSATGCDSARTLNLTVNPNVTSSITTSICSGTSYAGHSTNGTYVDHYTSAAGCDSVRTLNLTVNSSIATSVTTAICAGSNYAGHTTGGTFVDHYTAIGGCDSARTLNLTVNPNVTSTITTAICQGSNYAGHTTTGTFTDHYTNATGCDSARTLNLTVNVPTGSVTQYATCVSALPYVWNGLNINAAGNDTIHLTNTTGCDSMAILSLTVNTATGSLTNYTICPSALPYVWNGLNINAAGSDTIHLTGATGCDSMAVLNLAVSTVSNSTNNLAVCPSDLPYTWNGLTFATAGSQTATGFVTSLGCDSSATLDLTVNAVSNSTSSIAICSAELPYTWNGISISTAGNDTVHLTNAAGCDSLAVLSLSVNHIDSSVSQAAQLLTANQAGAAYQWINCSNNQPIVSATLQTYTATQNGNYACVVTSGNCTDTTGCVSVNTIGIETVTDYNFSLYPNPNNGNFTLQFSDNKTHSVSITDVTGRLIVPAQQVTAHKDFDCSTIATGVYMVTIKDEDGIKSVSMVVTK